MNRNPKLLIVLGVLSVLLIAGFLWMSAGSSATTHTREAKNTHAPFDVASGDTNNEVLGRIIAQQKALQTKNAQQASLIHQLQRTNASQAREQLTKTKAALEQQIAALKTSLAEQMNTLVQRAKTSSGKSNSALENYTVGQGQTKSHSHMITSVPDFSLTPVKGEASGAMKSHDTGSVSSAPTLPSDQDKTLAQQKAAVPVYTVPDGSTVANVALLSPLIGEVPVNGSLQAPAFPFKAMLSYHQTQQMFAANGIPLPTGLAGTILQGYSVGSMSLGCARPYVTKLLFVFKDGHFVVFPKKTSSGNATQVYPKNALGYLSDAYNNPCINGRYMTDAPKVIASFMALGAAQGAGGAIAQAQTQTLTNIAQGTAGTVFNGNLGKYAAGLAVNEGAKDATAWYKARVNTIFDAVFVPSTENGRARRLIFNVTQTIPIDLNHQGRLLHHERFSDGSTTDHSLL